MTSAFVSLGLRLVIASAPTPPAADDDATAMPPPAASRPAAEASEAALVHFEAGRYAEAREAIARAYMIEPWPQFLFARAQIERADGRCRPAIDFYELYLAEDPPPKAAASSRAAIDRCRARLLAEARRSWRRDPAALGLWIVGGVSATIGIGFAAAAGAERAAADRAADHDGFDRELRRARRNGPVGVAMLSVGGALLLAGVIRAAVLTQQRRKAALAWVVDGAGLGVRW